MLFYDFEVFSHDWLVVIKDTDTRTTHKILNDEIALRKIYEDNKDNIWVGYNSRSYDQYIFKGILLGTKRLLKCNPKSDYGFDPIPINIKGDFKWLL